MKKQLIDQTAHFLAAILILAPVLLFPHPVTAMATALGIGIVREITEAGTKVTWATVRDAFTPWSMFDIMFWGVGGLVAGLLFL